MKKERTQEQPSKADLRSELLQLMLSQYDPASEYDPDCQMLTSADIIANAGETYGFSVEEVTAYLRANGFTLQLHGTRWYWLVKQHRIR